MLGNFNNLNLPKDAIDAASKILQANNYSYNMPKCLVEPAKETAKTISECKTLESRRQLLSRSLTEAMKTENITFTSAIANEFERAVMDYAQNPNAKTGDRR